MILWFYEIDKQEVVVGQEIIQHSLHVGLPACVAFPQMPSDFIYFPPHVWAIHIAILQDSEILCTLTTFSTTESQT